MLCGLWVLRGLAAPALRVLEREREEERGRQKKRVGDFYRDREGERWRPNRAWECVKLRFINNSRDYAAGEQFNPKLRKSKPKAHKHTHTDTHTNTHNWVKL